MSFATTKNHIVRAGLESIPYQISDVVLAMEKDTGLSLKELNTDGGITTNNFVMQFIADLLNKKAICISTPDVSALGAAYLAGLHAGVYKSLDQLKQLNTEKKIYQPSDSGGLQQYYCEWKKRITTNKI